MVGLKQMWLLCEAVFQLAVVLIDGVGDALDEGNFTWWSGSS